MSVYSLNDIGRHWNLHRFVYVSFVLVHFRIKFLNLILKYGAKIEARPINT
ncbi:hypothetical protein GCM10027180_14610 [Microbulbifer echini]